MASQRGLYHFRMLLHEIDAVYHCAANKFNLSDSAAMILYSLRNLDGSCNLTELCRSSGLSKQTLHSAIQSMEAEDLIVLEAVDGKSKRLRLTAAGEEAAAQTVDRLIAAEESVCASGTQEELALYIKLTKLYYTTLKSGVEAMEPINQPGEFK